VGIGERKQIQLIKIVSIQNAEGVWANSEGDKIGCWAEVRNPSGFREFANGQTQMEMTKVFMVRFRFDKHPGVQWKIRYQDKDWTVQQRQEDNEKRFYWNITATSKSNV